MGNGAESDGRVAVEGGGVESFAVEGGECGGGMSSLTEMKVERTVVGLNGKEGSG